MVKPCENVGERSEKIPVSNGGKNTIGEKALKNVSIFLFGQYLPVGIFGEAQPC